MNTEQWNQRLAFFDSLIAMNSDFERKGKAMPYTSANGHMFSQLNKAGEIGIRLPKESREAFIADYQTTLFSAYGTVMKEYVLIPEKLHDQPQLLNDLLSEAFVYVSSLAPKAKK
ncbi:MAG: hypothetical protein ACRBHB_08230 [Arenicella sp.]